MIRRPPRSTLDRSSAASDVYKRQIKQRPSDGFRQIETTSAFVLSGDFTLVEDKGPLTVSYTHLRAHETVLDLVCRLLLEKKKNKKTKKKTQNIT